MKEEIKNDLKYLNIFFCLEEREKPDYFDNILKIINEEQDKLINKGSFNKLQILEEISYYLGNRIQNRGKIKKKQTQNVIISYLSFDDSTDLLISFITKFERGIVKNDAHPFFIFLPYKNNDNLNKQNLMNEIKEFQRNKNKERMLDSRNISFESQETIYAKIISLYEYFNESYENNIDLFEKNDKNLYDKSNTINIMVIGKRGTGKSTFINRLLGEKKAYAQRNGKTSIIKEYYHKKYPLKIIDSEGFEIGNKNQIDNVKALLKSNNLNYEKLIKNKKIHFILYLFKNRDKIEDIELEIIRNLYKYNIYMFFIISNMNEEDEESSKNDLEEALSNYQNKNENNEIEGFNENEIEDILKNTFCLDFLDENYSDTFKNIISSIYEILEGKKETNDKIIEYYFNYNNLIQTKGNDKILLPNDLLNENQNLIKRDKGILRKNSISPPEEIILLIKQEIKNNIFYTDYETDRKNKKQLAEDILDKYKKYTFAWGMIPIPFLDSYLSNKSREKMILEIGNIYSVVIKKRQEENNSKEYEEDKPNARNIGNTASRITSIVGALFQIGQFSLKTIFFVGGIGIGLLTSLITGGLSLKETLKIGQDIIDEFDKEYVKINIIDIYYDLAKKLNDNFQMLRNFPNDFDNGWYDIDINQINE